MFLRRIALRGQNRDCDLLGQIARSSNWGEGGSVILLRRDFLSGDNRGDYFNFNIYPPQRGQRRRRNGIYCLRAVPAVSTIYTDLIRTKRFKGRGRGQVGLDYFVSYSQIAKCFDHVPKWPSNG